jgi:formate transporter
MLKAALCNWMVRMGVAMGLTSRSTLGKIVACWLPIFTFFALGYEHSVVNMFIIPGGIWMGAPVSFSDWWLWNQLPVTVGNFLGGSLFVGLPMLWMSGRRATKDLAFASSANSAPSVAAEAQAEQAQA